MQAAEIIFEEEGGGIIDIFEDQLPYDLDQDVIDIAPERLRDLVCGYDG